MHFSGKSYAYIFRVKFFHSSQYLISPPYDDIFGMLTVMERCTWNNIAGPVGVCSDALYVPHFENLCVTLLPKLDVYRTNKNTQRNKNTYI